MEIVNEIVNRAFKSKARPIVLALHGELGAGKTTFVQALAKELGVEEEVRSPTFLLIRAFKLIKPKDGIEHLVHIDCYRITSAKELLDLGLKNILADPKNIVAVEWAERVAEYLPQNAIHLTFEITGEKERKIFIKKQEH